MALNRCPNLVLGIYRCRLPAGHNPIESPCVHDTKSDFPQCDFCDERYPSWLYPAEDFNTFEAYKQNEVTYGSSKGAWAACNTCYEFIESGQWDQLAQRSIDTMPDHEKLNRDQRRQVKRYLKVLHQGFTSNRTGPPQRIRGVFGYGEEVS